MYRQDFHLQTLTCLAIAISPLCKLVSHWFGIRVRFLKNFNSWREFILQTLTVFGPAISSFYKLASHSCGKACRNVWLFPVIQACFTLMWQSLPKRLALDPKWKNRKSDIFDTVKFGSGHIEQSCSITFQNQNVSTLFWSSSSVVRYIDRPSIHDGSTISFSLHRKDHLQTSVCQVFTDLDFSGSPVELELVFLAFSLCIGLKSPAHLIQYS